MTNATEDQGRINLLEMGDGELLSDIEIRRLLNISNPTLWRWRKLGHFPYPDIAIGGVRRTSAGLLRTVLGLETGREVVA
jgi:hypothetical protein